MSHYPRQDPKYLLTSNGWTFMYKKSSVPVLYITYVKTLAYLFNINEGLGLLKLADTVFWLTLAQVMLKLRK